MDDDAIRSLVTRLARARPSGGVERHLSSASGRGLASLKHLPVQLTVKQGSAVRLSDRLTPHQAKKKPKHKRRG